MEKQKIDFRLEAKNLGDKTVVYLYGDIVEEQPINWWTGEPEEGEYIYPAGVREIFDEIKTEKIDLHINSYGGNIFASVSIFNYLKGLDKDISVVIDGLAASGASLIAMAGNKIKMPKNTLMMIHRASSYGWGNCMDLRSVADTLEKLDNTTVLETYKSRFKGTQEELKDIIDKETWLSAEECFNYGLCDELVELSEDKPEEVTDQEVSNAIRFMNNFARLKLK